MFHKGGSQAAYDSEGRTSDRVFAGAKGKYAMRCTLYHALLLLVLLHQLCYGLSGSSLDRPFFE